MAVSVCPVQWNFGCDLVFTHTVNKLQKIPTKKQWIKQNNNTSTKQKGKINTSFSEIFFSFITTKNLIRQVNKKTSSLYI